MTADIRKVQQAFNNPKAPKTITQEPHDFDPGHLKRLCHLEKGVLPDVGDLGAYAADISYVQETQPDLFRYLLPLCLDVWRHNLTTNDTSDFSGVVDQIVSALAKRSLLADHLTIPQQDAVSGFMRDAVLDRLDQEFRLHHEGARDGPYPWFSALGTIAVIFPRLEALWDPWWGMVTPGRAIGALQYTSCLMYEQDRNPIFAPWTRDGGGGPPGLWEDEGTTSENPWQPENTDFLRRKLNHEYLRDAIDRAATVLEGEIDSPVPERMKTDFDGQRPLLDQRLALLPKILARPLDETLDWSDWL